MLTNFFSWLQYIVFVLFEVNYVLVLTEQVSHIPPCCYHPQLSDQGSFGEFNLSDSMWITYAHVCFYFHIEIQFIIMLHHYIAGSTGHTSGECIVKAASNARKYHEGLCWIGSREQHDPRVQVNLGDRIIVGTPSSWIRTWSFPPFYSSSENVCWCFHKCNIW
jgi:hypothetical protein